ncbi:MAG: hypothetical protein SPI44_05690 [Bacilli bacterium]|nr:hypothetical protein [Bacilli bacterium]
MSNKNINNQNGKNSKTTFTQNGINIILKDTGKKQKQKTTENLYDSIANFVELYLKEIKSFNNELSSILKIKNIEEKEKRLLEKEKTLSKRIDMYEYLANPDTEIIARIKMIESFRHNYYNLKNNILSIKSEIMINKLDTYEEKISRISFLETKFENFGATVISIILSISIISAAITAIEKLKFENVLVFVVSIVWFGMTYLLFVHYLFNKNKEKNKGAVVLYAVITIIWILVLFYSCKGDIIGTFSTL